MNSISILLFGVVCICRGSIVAIASDEEWNYTDQDAWKHVIGWNCDGIRQSPVDIDIRNLTVNNDLITLRLWNFEQSFNGTFTNNGHTVRFDPSPGSPTALFQNHLGTYELDQVHFHWGADNGQGSEHTINEGGSSGEIHFVGKKTTGLSTDGDALAVIGVFIIGHNLITLKGSWSELYFNMPIRNHGVNPVYGVRLTDFLPPDFTFGTYFHYEGSLTTPPCSEVVQWFVLGEPIYMSRTFTRKLRTIEGSTGQALTMNYRFTQPLRGRQVMITNNNRHWITQPGDRSRLNHNPDKL